MTEEASRGINKDTSSTTHEIQKFRWKSFPFEKDRFSICICVDTGEDKKEEIDNLINYIKLIYPEDFLYVDCFNEKIDWSHTFKSIEYYKKNKEFIIATGSIDKIPKFLLTISDIIIFSSIVVTNKYLEPRHHNTITSSIDDKNIFLVIDKRRLGLKYSVISKSEIDKYKKN